jgi:hypothetical protein
MYFKPVVNQPYQIRVTAEPETNWRVWDDETKRIKVVTSDTPKAQEWTSFEASVTGAGETKDYTVEFASKIVQELEQVVLLKRGAQFNGTLTLVEGKRRWLFTPAHTPMADTARELANAKADIVQLAYSIRNEADMIIEKAGLSNE